MTIDNNIQREQWFIIPVNPQAWTVPPFSAGRNKKSGKLFVSPGQDKQGADFKEAVREELERQGAYMMKAPYALEFWFDHKLETGDNKEVDATNMQKLAEDALQGLVIDNDRNVVDIHSRKFMQGEHYGMFMIHVTDNFPEPGIPFNQAMDWLTVRDEIKEGGNRKLEEIKDMNSWP